MKRILLALCAIVILLSGCNSDKTDMVTKSEQDLVGVYIPEEHIRDVQLTNSDDSWKYEVAQKLYEEFCYFYERRNTDMTNDKYYIHYGEPLPYHSYVNYYRVMAADRANGVYTFKDYLSKDKVDYVLSKCDEINEKLSGFVRLFFGYTDSGLHYLGIIYDFTTNSYYCRPMCDKVRGDTNESEFLNEIYSSSLFRVYDIFTEDLTGKRSTINMDVEFINMSDYKPVVVENYYDLLDEGNLVLKKYGRKLVAEGTNEFKNKSWNLYAVKSIADKVYICSYGKKIQLTQYAPTY